MGEEEAAKRFILHLNKERTVDGRNQIFRAFQTETSWCEHLDDRSTIHHFEGNIPSICTDRVEESEVEKQHTDLLEKVEEIACHQEKEEADIQTCSQQAQ